MGGGCKGGGGKGGGGTGGKGDGSEGDGDGDGEGDGDGGGGGGAAAAGRGMSDTLALSDALNSVRRRSSGHKVSRDPLRIAASRRSETLAWEAPASCS